MQSLLSRFSLRVQIGLLVILAGFVFGLSAVIQLASRHQVEASLEVATVQRQLLDFVVDVDVGLLQARRHEKNFLMRHDALSQKEHAEAATAMRTALDGMAAVLPAEAGEMRAQVDTVRRAVEGYVEAFRAMVRLQAVAGLGPSDGAVGEMRDAARKMEEEVGRADQPRLAVQLLLMRGAEREFLARPSPQGRDDWAARMTDFQRAVPASDMVAAQRASVLERLAVYQSSFQSAGDAIGAVRDAEKVMIKVHREVLEPSLNALAAQTRGDMAAAQRHADELSAWAGRLSNAVEIGGFIVVMMVGWLLAHSIYHPLNEMTRVMQRLAAGGMDIAIPAQDRRDEVGAMARSVQVFHDAMAEAARLRIAQEEDHRQATREKAAAVLAMADDFEVSVKTKVGAVDDATSGIRSTAQAMATRSERSGSRSLDVGEAARITNERAASASEATRQLALAVNEIARQVAQSSTISRKTVEDVNATASQMGELSGSVRAIGEIVQMINEIAAQTNLLALNATIEAARAGDAGKGFAVVAGEVKTLASQTARATDEISRQVSDIQASSRRMADSIVGVVDIIRSLDEISSAIASAVQEQEAATRDIADNIDEVAHQADAVSRSVGDLSKASALTCAGTVRVLWSAKSLTDVVDSLTGETDGFLGRVRQQDRT